MVGNTNVKQLEKRIDNLMATGLWEAHSSIKPNIVDDKVQLIYHVALIHADGMEISGTSDDEDLAFKYFFDNLKKIDTTEIIDLTNEHSHDAAIAAQ